MKQELLLQQDMINGFSYSFTKALFEKLKELLEKKSLFKNEGPHQEGKINPVTPIGNTVLHYLGNQLGDQYDLRMGNSDSATDEKVATLLAAAEEFLSIFEKKE